jgi:hypothetical protein
MESARGAKWLDVGFGKPPCCLAARSLSLTGVQWGTHTFMIKAISKQPKPLIHLLTHDDVYMFSI